MKFGIAPATKWKLGQNMGRTRKRRLLETPFESIVQHIIEQAELHDYECEPIDKCPGAKRVWVQLKLSCQTVDLFHNGAGGYRAGFYLGVQQGEAANRYLIDSFLAALKSLCSARPKRNCPWELIEASLRHHDAKIWIREGAWLTDNRATDRNLMVDRWEQNAKEKVMMKYRFEASWARLTPDSETRLELKGGCVDETCSPVDVQLKPSRSQELHDHGFT